MPDARVQGLPETPVPSGTVTFLFTDIEGSTRLLERLREQYATLLNEQRELLRAVFARWNGREMDAQGDAFFVAFPRALDAVNCVIEAQRELAAHSWPKNAEVKVRMGLHTGEPIIARTGYVGMDVHRAARIASTGYGGQVLLSQTTRDLVYADLPGGTKLRGLGAHILKDIAYPQEIYQLDIPGLPSDFPALKSLEKLDREEIPPAPGQPPYKGLQFFNEGDAEWFYGRQAVSARLAEAVQAQRFLAVVGASGSGKSSVVRAGLVPILRRDQAVDWQIHVITPSAHPPEALAVSLTRGTESVTATATLIDDLGADRRSLQLYAHRLLASQGAGTGRQRRLLLIIDQLEELFTQCRSEAERRALIDNLLSAVTADRGPVTAVITLRADFYERVAEYPELRELVSSCQVYIGAMNAAELREAIEEPARRGGWEFSPGLVDLILHDVGAGEGRQPEPGALPLLSHALLETWKRRRGTLMNLRAYTEAGGVRGAIARTAETVYARELTPAQQQVARSIFLRLTELGEGTQDTRRRISIHELIPPGPAGDTEQIRDVLLKLADARLITTSEGTVEVAHEALIREWPMLREWLAQDREGLRLHRHLTEAAQEWGLLERDPGALLRGARLMQAVEWALANPRQLNAQEQAYLEASREAAEREQVEREAQRQRELEAAQKLAEAERQRAEQQAQSVRRLRQRAVYLAVALVTALGLAAAALLFFRQANNNANVATSRELALAALNNLEADPERSILLGLRSAAMWSAAGQPVPNDLQDTLHRAIQADRIRLNWPAGGEDILYVGFNPADGSPRVVTGNPQAGHVKLVNPESGQVLLTLPARPDTFPDVAISPDGKYIALPGDGNAVVIWEIASGRQWRTLLGHSDPVRGAAFDASGTLLASYALGEQIIWDIASGRKLLQLPPRGGESLMVFSPAPPGGNASGALVATKAGQAIKVVDVASGRELLSHEHGYDVVGFAFSPDGKRVAAGGRGNNPTVWDVVTGQTVYTVTTSAATGCMAGQLEATAFSPDGKRLALGPCILDAATGERLFTLLGHTGSVTRLAFSADGTRLITASYDGTVKVWDLTASREVLTVSHPPVVYGVAFSPNGELLVTAGMDGNALVWDMASGSLLQTLAGHSDIVNGAAFSPDGRLLATFSADRTVVLWDVASGQAVRTLTGHAADRPAAIPLMRGVIAGAFNPQCDTSSGAGGCRLATVGFDGQLIVWDVSTGQQVFTYQESDGGLKSVAYSPDGTRLAVGSATRVGRSPSATTILDAASGQVLHTLPAYPGWVWGLAFNPDGTRLASVNFWESGKVWDVATGQLLLNLQGPQQVQNSMAIAFSPTALAGNTGNALLATGTDQAAILWDAGSGLPLLTLGSIAGPVFSVAFSPDGKYLAASAWDGTAHVYVVRPEDLLALARSRLTRALTAEECQKYLHAETCPAVP